MECLVIKRCVHGTRHTPHARGTSKNLSFKRKLKDKRPIEDFKILLPFDFPTPPSSAEQKLAKTTNFVVTSRANERGTPRFNRIEWGTPEITFTCHKPANLVRV
jgi:hypothetical protein